MAALAVLGVALLGATTVVSRPALSWEANSDRLLVAWALAAIGTSAAGYVIYREARRHDPVILSLDALPPGPTYRLRAHPDDYGLPADIATARSLRAALTASRAAADEARETLAAAMLAQAREPEDEAAKQQAHAARTALELRYEEEQRYEKAAAALLEEANHDEVRRLHRLPGHVLAVGVLGVICGLGYQLLLTTPPDRPQVSAVDAEPAPALLVRDGGNAANGRLWATLGLQACYEHWARSAGGVPVIVLSGKGTPESPHRVRTIPLLSTSGHCPSLEFNVLDVVARVVEVPAVRPTIAYSPESTP